VHVSQLLFFVFGDMLPLHKNHDTMKTPKIEDYVNLPFGLARCIGYKGTEEATPAITGWLHPSPAPFPFQMTSIKMTNIQHTILKTHGEYFRHVQAIVIFSVLLHLRGVAHFFHTLQLVYLCC
jgi:hypothetical protein